MTHATSNLTRDAFLGGQLTVSQPVTGYRAGVDPVFLAAAVPAEPGQSVLELGWANGSTGCGLSVWSVSRCMPTLPG